ncbi:hypothetical protein GGR50DRAFT_667523 [Xylaria sp. CBS 124048]|nr:hypothetical protein GGR50DRAFT_667523 [Xylaria sp. CBS 124048]
MGPFALAVPLYRLGVHKQKKAQRQEDVAGSRSPSPDDDSDTGTQFSSSSRLPSESINPLSHSPNTLHQLAIAGLSPEDELPSLVHPGFPHTPLPARSSRNRRGDRSASVGSATVQSDDDGSGTEANPTSRGRTVDELGLRRRIARIRHMNTMMAIMHRCLRDGDMARAKRAFGLLVRTRDVDLRIDNFWALGSEILMRDGETPVRPPPRGTSSRFQTASGLDSDSDSDSILDDEEVEPVVEEEEHNVPSLSSPPRRWGNASNIAKVKTYLETLIQQHPFDAFRPHMTNAFDFWPALFGFEIYSLNAEYMAAQYKIDVEHPNSSLFPRPELHHDSDDGMEIDNNDHTEEHEAWSNTTDGLRATTQQGALDIAAHLDTVLETTPYNKHAELLRLRAHLALFVADLHLPSRLTRRYEDHARETGNWDGSFRRLRTFADTPAERSALVRRKEEMRKGKAFLGRMREVGGPLDGWEARLLGVEDEEE